MAPAVVAAAAAAAVYVFGEVGGGGGELLAKTNKYKHLQSKTSHNSCGQFQSKYGNKLKPDSICDCLSVSMILLHASNIVQWAHVVLRMYCLEKE